MAYLIVSLVNEKSCSIDQSSQLKFGREVDNTSIDYCRWVEKERVALKSGMEGRCASRTVKLNSAGRCQVTECVRGNIQPGTAI